MKPLIASLLLLASGLSAFGESKPGALYPEGELFPIGGYSPRPERDKAAGFSLAGPTYGNSRALLEKCEKAGLSVVYRIRPGFNVKRSTEPLTETLLEEIRREVQEEVAAVAASTHIHSWTISPEELRYWRPRERVYLQHVAEAIRASDPTKRPIWMYEPGHRTSRALSELLPLMDMSAKGMYVNYAGRQEHRIWTRASTEAQAEAIANANPQARLFVLPEMFRQPPAGTEEKITQWVRHDCYSAILNGAEGILIFSFAKRSGFTAWESYYNAYAAVARELNGEQRLGLALLTGEPTSAAAQCKVLSGPAQALLPAKLPSEKEHQYPSLSTKSFLWRGSEYLLLVNSANAPLTVSLPGADWQDQAGIALGQPLALPPWGVAILQRHAGPHL